MSLNLRGITGLSDDALRAIRDVCADAECLYSDPVGNYTSSGRAAQSDELESAVVSEQARRAAMKPKDGGGRL
jgi:hypothetical protein